jgi:cytochrome P450
MTILDHNAWSNRRRSVAAHYTNTNLALFQPELAKYTLKLVDGLNADHGKTAFDMMSVFRHLLVRTFFFFPQPS